MDFLETERRSPTCSTAWKRGFSSVFWRSVLVLVGISASKGNKTLSLALSYKEREIRLYFLPLKEGD